jgi:arylsulfatase A-like enzyme
VHAHRTGVYGNRNNLRHAPKARDLVTLPQYFSRHGYHSLSMGKIFHRHPAPGDQGSKKSDAGQWAFDEHHGTRGGMGPASKQRPVNGLPNLPNENPSSYHYRAFDWGPTVKNDETEMLDYKTARWAAEQLRTRDFNGKPFFMAIGISKPHLTWYVPQKYFDARTSTTSSTARASRSTRPRPRGCGPKSTVGTRRPCRPISPP